MPDPAGEAPARLAYSRPAGDAAGRVSQGPRPDRGEGQGVAGDIGRSKLNVKNDPIQPNRCAELLSALAAPERLRIIRLLRSGPRNVSQIAEQLDMPAVNLAHHLSILRHAGLLANEKRGRFVIYSLVPGVLENDEPAAATEHLNLGCCRIELPRKQR